MGNDPRTDQHPQTGADSKPYPTPNEGGTSPAPGGAGTDTKGAPEHEPAAQPKK